MPKRSEKKNVRSSEIFAKVAGASVVGQRLPSWLSRDWVWGLILVLAVILAYQPVWYAGFIWDDDYHVTTNPCIVGPLGFKDIWMTAYADISPLTRSTFWLEHALWGLAPLPYHLVNVLMHGACAVVLWRVLRSLQVPGAWLGAALWALHPVEVESVAWITEMKNTESGLFFLLSILFFVRRLKSRGTGERNGGGWYYALTLVFAALAMASKSSTVILPVALCLCAWWIEGRWHWRNLARVVPVFLMSVATSAVSIWTQSLNLLAAPDPQWVRNWPERLAGAGDAIWFYLGKLVWPHPLIAIYPRWGIDAGQWLSYLPLLAVLVVLFILWLKRGSWSRLGFFVFTYFLAALLPVLGLVDNPIFRYSLVFDHFQYLASMGPLALAGAGMARLSDFVIPGKSWLRTSLCAGVLLILGTLSWQRAWAYESEETLWTDALAKNPECWLGCNNLGEALLEKGRIDEAMTQFQRSLEINRNCVEARNNLGFALVQKGRVNEAIAQFQKALEINPNYPGAHFNLGNALSQKGQMNEATAQFQKAVEINPNYAEAHNNLGVAFLRKGQVDEAIAQYQKALEINPNYAEAHCNLGKALLQKGQVEEAIVQYQKALEINPSYANARYNFGNALLQKGQLDEAMAQFQKALEINPSDARYYCSLGNVLLQKRRVDDAMIQYEKALKIDPNYPQAHTNLGIVLCQKGRVDEAIAEFQVAIRLDPDDSNAKSNLAKVQAMGRPTPGSK